MAKVPQKKLLLSELQLGMTVKLPLSWTNHPFLFNRVEVNSDAQIEMIRGLGVTYVFLLSELNTKPNIAKADTEDEIEIEPERDLKADTRKAIRLSQKRFLMSVNNCRDVYGKVVSDPEGAYRLSAVLAQDLLSHLQEVDTPFLTLVGMDEKEVSVTQHGVSVAVLAMMIGHALDLAPKELGDIALGSLFHDIGKLKIPEAIRRKHGALTPQETNFIQMHPNFGFDMLNRCGLFPKEVLNIVLHHHEFVDGSGFPDGLTGNKIPITTQIVSLANDYDQQLSGQQIMSPQIALGFLFKNHASKHAESLISVLVKILGIYPPGTIVKLSDGYIAKVIMTTKEVSQPQVWACKEDGSDATLRFLIHEGVTIQQAIKAEELTEGAIRSLQVDKGISFYFSSLQT
ncbi:HD-GYP domain-containing protein [Shewanella sp. MF08487]|uniref:HD-GYP domain-containing protein n=1 Tax=Shewanella sp. MF08487 TaxID=3434873 RepID=UPI003D79AD62